MQVYACICMLVMMTARVDESSAFAANDGKLDTIAKTSKGIA